MWLLIQTAYCFTKKKKKKVFFPYPSASLFSDWMISYVRVGRICQTTKKYLLG